MMRQNPRLFRLSATVAIGALLSNALLPPVWAQPAPPPPGSPAAPPDQNQGDPPERVGRIASAIGAVSFRTSADTQWSAASPNYPVSAGEAFWTEPGARMELEISGSRLDLSGQTEFDVTTLDAGGLQAVVSQGELYLHLLDLAPNEVWSLETPRGAVRITAIGRYDIVVGTTEQPTQVTVLEGSATIEGPGVSLKVTANQTATVTGTGPFEGTIGPASRDAFLAARLAAERPPAQVPTVIQGQLTYMSGAEDLSGYGEWSESSEYGEVWYPSVAAGWVPYRDGEWSYVAPWGWTWVDSAPWGFAPFHYGRWAQVDGRWGWLPGARTAGWPVYAPALVAFIGLSAGVALGAAFAHGSVGWVPLGPNEAYHPWYHASEGYLRQVNIGHVRDPAEIHNNVTINNFANRGAATAVPASVMQGSRPVRTAARGIPAQAFAAAHPVVGQEPIRPTAGTLGVTPAVARQLNLPAGGGGVMPRRAAPGPVVRAQEGGATNGALARPALIGPRGEQPGGPARPGEAVVPGVVHVPGGPPPLASPGARPAGLPEPGGARPGERFTPGEVPGLRPEGAPSPGNGPESGRARPEGAPEPREARPEEPRGATPPAEVRPEGPGPRGPEREPLERPPAAERPEGRPAEHAAPEARPAERPAPEARPAERPAPEARPVERPAPEARPVERAPEPRAAPPPRVEARPPPRAEPPRAAPARPAPQKRPGER